MNEYVVYVFLTSDFFSIILEEIHSSHNSWLWQRSVNSYCCVVSLSMSRIHMLIDIWFLHIVVYKINIVLVPRHMGLC